MLCTKILVAYDESDLAKKSLEKAVEIAKTHPAIEINVLNVIKIPAQEFIVLEAYQEIYDHMRQYGQTIISNARSILASLPNNIIHCCQEEGAPAQVILDYAKDNNCDLIIMGSRGLSGIKEFLGSVSHAVVQKSPVPVLIVK